jgi:Flp pilus assembly protein TadG
MINRRKEMKGQRGQVLILCAVCLVILLLFVGLAIDFGMAYVTRAKLGKAADAAALTGARYSAQGVATATSLAQSSFAMNYGSSSPAPAVAFTSDANGNTLVNVNATAAVKTAFLGLLPGFNTLNVSSAAQSMARTIVMTLVLDRTGSMGLDGGGAVLPAAVSDFIGYFDDTKDSVALVSFANDVTVDVSMTTGNFKQAITNAANAMQWQGATWSDGALQQALTTETTSPAPSNINLSKVVVFFTDGNANTVSGPLVCTGANNIESGTWHFGGSDNSAYIGFVTTDNSDYKNGKNCKSGLAAGDSAYPITGNPQNFCAVQYNDNSACNGTFNSLAAGGPAPLDWNHVAGATGDARYRAILDANNMRAAGITVYAIGLGSATEPVDQGFLCQIANDPCSSTYDASKPSGVMQWAGNSATLDAAFQTVATIIRLRLTQ